MRLQRICCKCGGSSSSSSSSGSSSRNSSGSSSRDDTIGLVIEIKCVGRLSNCLNWLFDVPNLG